MCVRLHSESSEPTMFSRKRLTNTPRRHRLADGQLSSLFYPPSPSFGSFGAACDVLLRSSCLFERTLTAVCALPEYQSCLVNIICIQTFCDDLNIHYIFDRTDLYRFEVNLRREDPPLRLSSFPLYLSPPDATAKPMPSSHHFTPPRQVSALVWHRLCK